MLKLLQKILFLSWVVIIPAIFTSCSLIQTGTPAPEMVSTEIPVLEPTKFKILLIDTPTIKFYDFASLKYAKGNKNLTIDLYKLGKSVGQITLSPKEVCVMKSCMSKWMAAKRFFGAVSYPDLFNDILAAKDIFDGEGRRFNNEGSFVQWFVKGGQEIYYERSKNKVFFKNITTGITIGIEDYIPQP